MIKNKHIKVSKQAARIVLKFKTLPSAYLISLLGALNIWGGQICLVELLRVN